MDQSEINQEIVNSTHRMLEQIKALEVCPNTPNGNHHRKTNLNDSQSSSSEVMNLISSLQTDQSEELLRDVHNWGDARVHTYETYEKPLLDQMEINQKSDSSLVDELSPRLEVNINNFDNKLTNAKVAVATLAESLIKQRCIDTSEVNKNNIDSNNSCGGYPSTILQFQAPASNEQQEPVNIQPDDYDQMRLREAHLVQIVGELSNEVELMSNEAVSRNLEILNMQHEAEQKEKELNEVLANNKEKEELIISFSNRIDELEKQLEAEKKKFEEISSELNNNNRSDGDSRISIQNSEISSQTKNNSDDNDIADDTETKRKFGSIIRSIDNFFLDIECDENIIQEQKNKEISNPSIRTIDNFSLDIECDYDLFQSQLELKNEANNNHNNIIETKEPRKFKKLGEARNQLKSDSNNNNSADFDESFDTKATPTAEFESLLLMENEESPNDTSRSSILPLGIKQRQIYTENGKRKGHCTFRLFFKDRDGGAVIVDVEVARKDEKTGVMLLKPSDVRTTSSPNKKNRLTLIDPSNEYESVTPNELQSSEPANQKENEISSKKPNSNETIINQTKLNNLSPTINNSTTTSNKNSHNFNCHNLGNNRNSQIPNTAPRNNNNINNNANIKKFVQHGQTSNQNFTNNSKPLTRQQEIMKRILEIHERQLAKIKAARAAAAASYYAVRLNAVPHESVSTSSGIEEANVINLNKNVERQIRFDKNGNGSWSNFSSKPVHSSFQGSVVGEGLFAPKNNKNQQVAQSNPRMLPYRNKKIVVPGGQKQKMKSPRRPFIL